MGKGDRKTRRGKITLGTYGVRRPRKKKKSTIVNKIVEENTNISIETNVSGEETFKKVKKETTGSKKKTTKKSE